MNMKIKEWKKNRQRSCPDRKIIDAEFSFYIKIIYCRMDKNHFNIHLLMMMASQTCMQT